MSATLVQRMPNIEATSANIDAVNVLKAPHTPKQSGLYDASEFDGSKNKDTFRQFEDAEERVKSFYSQQHTLQTVAFNLKARNDFRSKTRARMGVWEAMEKLNTFIDECDPDTQESQMSHLLQTSEAMRKDGKPRWMQLVGLIHDHGKLLFFYGAKGHWDVVGDTFPVGCKFDDRIIFGTKSFEKNEDNYHPVYSTEFGICSPGCGLDNVVLSWGPSERRKQALSSASHSQLATQLTYGNDVITERGALLSCRHSRRRRAGALRAR
ncbi:unnamed protein product [Clonostachys rosea]|uniref:Inositol oxygenase n=1 Tax=Bionectria ochroleuca TaxID=29856 RepID=A0ABY6U3M3_BIOOC|nr:unnamed protein product [Clonostachys rosea]